MVYRFDDYTLDPEERTLKRRQVAVDLTPKVFQTLLVLVQNRDHVMTKDELLSTIWPEQIVEESNITQNISVLRRALGEVASGKKYIATFPGLGYRFMEPVQVVEASTSRNDFSDPTNSTLVDRSPSTYRAEGEPAQASGHIGDHRRSGYIYKAVAVFAALAFLVASGVLWRKRPADARSTASGAGAAPVNRTGPIRTLSRMEGAQFQPSWSPDGRSVAFVYSDPSGSRSVVYIENQTELQPRPVVSDSGEFSSPTFSPDGKFLAYLHIRANLADVEVVDLTTGKSKTLASLFPGRYGRNLRCLDWSPNGDFLVTNDKTSEKDPLSLYIIYTSTGRKVRLTYPNMDILGDVAPRFSPDGTEVAFIRMKYQYQYDVFVLPVTGGDARRLTANPGLLGDVDWESNSTLIFSADKDGESELWQVDSRSSHPQLSLASSVSADAPLQFSYSRASKQVAFSAYRPDLNIWALELTAKSVPAPSWVPVIRTAGQDIAPSFSRDGSKILFRSDISGRMQMWVSNADGSHSTVVASGDLIPGAASWSPDGESIVFSPVNSPGLYQVSLSHAFALRRITAMPVSHPSFSIDGQWIFARMGNFVYRIPVSGGAVEVLTDQGGAPIMQSKDGHYLYFGEGRMDTALSRLDLGTRRQEVVLETLIPGYRDAWTVTDGGIVFLTEEYGKPSIAYHDLETAKDTILAEFPGSLPPIGTSGFSVAPDSRRLLVVRADPSFASIQTAEVIPAVKP